VKLSEPTKLKENGQRRIVMQSLTSDFTLMLAIMIISWLISLVTGHLAVRVVLERSTRPWAELTKIERSSVLGLSGSGCFTGGIAFMVLAVSIMSVESILAVLNLPLILAWALIVMVSTAVGSAAVIRPKLEKKTDN
jgi:hypothetical protein